MANGRWQSRLNRRDATSAEETRPSPWPSPHRMGRGDGTCRRRGTLLKQGVDKRGTDMVSTKFPTKWAIKCEELVGDGTAGRGTAAGGVLPEGFGPGTVAVAVVGFADEADVASGGDFLLQAPQVGAEF